MNLFIYIYFFYYLLKGKMLKRLIDLGFIFMIIVEMWGGGGV